MDGEEGDSANTAAQRLTLDKEGTLRPIIDATPKTNSWLTLVLASVASSFDKRIKNEGISQFIVILQPPYFFIVLITFDRCLLDVRNCAVHE